MSHLRAPQQPRFLRPLPSRDWRAHARNGLGLEAVDCRPCCPSGSLVVGLLQLAVPMSEIASACGVSVAVLRLTVASRARKRAEVVDDATFARLAAMFGVAAARGLPEARAMAEADAVALGCAVSDPQDSQEPAASSGPEFHSFLHRQQERYATGWLPGYGL